MERLIKTIIIIIWIIDILNMDFTFNGQEIFNASLLDVDIPINTLFWILVFVFL